jgi:hypothetical protein
MEAQSRPDFGFATTATIAEPSTKILARSRS